MRLFDLDTLKKQVTGVQWVGSTESALLEVAHRATTVLEDMLNIRLALRTSTATFFIREYSAKAKFDRAKLILPNSFIVDGSVVVTDKSYPVGDDGIDEVVPTAQYRVNLTNGELLLFGNYRGKMVEVQFDSGFATTNDVTHGDEVVSDPSAIPASLKVAYQRLVSGLFRITGEDEDPYNPYTDEVLLTSLNAFRPDLGNAFTVAL